MICDGLTSMAGASTGTLPASGLLTGRGTITAWFGSGSWFAASVSESQNKSLI